MGALSQERGHCWVKRGSPFLRAEKMQMTTATPRGKALIGLCSSRCPPHAPRGAHSPSTAEELTLWSLTRWRLNSRTVSQATKVKRV